MNPHRNPRVTGVLFCAVMSALETASSLAIDDFLTALHDIQHVN